MVVGIEAAGNESAHPARAALARGFFLLATAVFAAWGLVAMWRYSVRDLYADQWRLYLQYLTRGFPENVAFLDNGHRPVLPNAVRVAESAWFDGNQQLQLFVAMALVASTLVLLWRLVARQPTRDRVVVGAAYATIAFGVCWMANARMLLHSNESLHVYFATASLALAATALWRVVDTHRNEMPALLLPVVCALAATLSFGAGMVLFPAALAALAISRSPWRSLATLAAAWLVAIVLYLLLPGAGGVRDSLQLDPVRNVLTAAAMLGSVPMHMSLPWTEPSLSYALPFAVMHGPSLKVAVAWTDAFGSIWTARTPQTLFGMVGIGLLLLSSWRVWATRRATPMAFAGLMLAWFGLGVAMLVSLGRLGYFDLYPGQTYANRYLPWACLFWAGVLLLQLAACGLEGERERRGARIRRAVVLPAVATAAVIMLLTNPLWTNWGRDLQVFARSQTAAFALGLVGPPGTLGETVPAEVDAALAVVRDHRIGAFGHPAMQWLGRTLPLAATPQRGAWESVPAWLESSVSLVGPQGMAFELRLPDDYPRRESEFWLLADASGRVVGLAHPNPLHSKSRLRGIAPAAAAPVYLVPWDDAANAPGRPQRIDFAAVTAQR